MYRFSRYSKGNLDTCIEPLQRIAHAAIEAVDFRVICGVRGEEDQNKAFDLGLSMKKYPNSKHNKVPSLAVDIVPWHKATPNIRWKDTDAFIYLAGHILMMAQVMGFEVRWGRDWDRDDDLTDETFFDFAHFELSGGIYVPKEKE